MFKFSTLFSVKPNENLINSSEFLPAANSNNGLIIDVRRLKDFKMGHLNKSIHIDFKKKSTFGTWFPDCSDFRSEKSVFWFGTVFACSLGPKNHQFVYHIANCL